MDAMLDHASAALAAARGAGLTVDRAEVVKVAANVLVRLEPGPYAARLTGATAPFRDCDAEQAGRALRACHDALEAIDPSGLDLEPLWSDSEDVHLAPLEWDLGCLVAAGRLRGNDFGWAEAALAAHGCPYDAALLDACVDARVAQGAAYLAATGRGAVCRHLAWLRVRASSA